MKLAQEIRNAVIESGIHRRHKDIPDYLETLGLSPPVNFEGTKREKIEESLSGISPQKNTQVGHLYLENFCSNKHQRNKIEDLIWATEDGSTISKRHRRQIASAIGYELYSQDGERGFDALLERLWILDTPLDFLTFPTTRRESLKDKIDRHIHRNPGDWSAHKLFQELGAYEAIDKRFCLFIEGLASGDVRPDEKEQIRFVHDIAPILRSCGFQFIEQGMRDGYPIFKIVSLDTIKGGKPKNIIFASSVKPDLRLSDAISNDVEVLTNQEQVLVYDRSISDSGLTWHELQNWWEDTHSISNTENGKRTLYQRLLKSLPEDSPPQRNFFLAYHNFFREKIPSLPALLPEVWLYWDHKTVSQRGAKALKNLRMDFLMLLSGHQRVVLEIDGKQHYAKKNGYAAPDKYAEMVKADREMKLLGYDIYRFGASELTDETNTQVLVGRFCQHLFKKYQITF